MSEFEVCGSKYSLKKLRERITKTNQAFYKTTGIYIYIDAYILFTTFNTVLPPEVLNSALDSGDLTINISQGALIREEFPGYAPNFYAV